MTDIIDQLPRLSTAERKLVFLRLQEIEGGNLDESPEMLAAIDEADAVSEDDDVTTDDLRKRVSQWSRTK